MSLSDWIVSWVRTQVAVWVPTLAAWLAGFGISLPVNEGTLVAGSLAVSVYYTLVRLLEAKWPAFGALLGFKRQPVYGPVQPAVSGPRGL